MKRAHGWHAMAKKRRAPRPRVIGTLICRGCLALVVENINLREDLRQAILAQRSAQHLARLWEKRAQRGGRQGGR